ncbi:hypothetical protein MBLNU457_7710t1 [Dothideomycetes sp. NU457]
MDHSHSSMPGVDHGDMDMGTCSMNMIFTWDYTNLCIIFRSWRITSPLTLIISLLAIVALTAGYEAVREASRRYEEAVDAKKISLPNDGEGEGRSLLGLGQSQAGVEKKARLAKAAFYAVQVFYSFFIMLLFMTYNGYVMLAVAVGAFVGYLAFGGGSASKSAACH